MEKFRLFILDKRKDFEDRKRNKRRQELVIIYVNGMLRSSDFDGGFDLEAFELDFYFLGLRKKDKIITGLSPSAARYQEHNFDMDVEDEKKLFHNFQRDVIETMFNNGYIFRISQKPVKFKLTDRGVLAKELGGHLEYQKYRRREINSIKNQTFINLGLVVATVLAAIMPFIAEHYKKEKPIQILHEQNPYQQQVVNISIDTVFLNQYIDYLKSKKKILKKNH